MAAAPESAEAASDGASAGSSDGVTDGATHGSSTVSEASRAQTGLDGDAEAAAEASVEVSAVVPHPLERVWRTLITREGTEALLGPGAALGGKGEPWRSKEGPHGVMRSYHPLEQVRLSWHADDDAPTSMVDLQLRPEGASTRLDLRHQHIGAKDTTHLQQRWSAALQRVNEATG